MAGQGPRPASPHASHPLEVALMAISLMATAAIGTGLLQTPGGIHLVALLAVPLVLWVTLRLGLGPALVATVLLAAAFWLGALLDRGAFLDDVRNPDVLSLLGLPAFMAAAAWLLARALAAHRRAHHELETSLELQKVLHEVLRLSTEPRPLPDILGRTLDLLFAVPWLGLEAKGAVFVTSPTNGSLRLVAHRDFPAVLQTKCAQVALGQCLCGRASKQREAIFASHVEDHHVTRFEGMADHGHYCVPIAADAEVLGVINLYVRAGHRPRTEEEQFLTAVAKALASVLEKRRAEEALQASEERFMLAIDGTDAGIWDWNLETDEVYFSPRWKSMLGHRDEEIQNEFGEWERRLHPEDREHALSTVKAYLAGESDEYELEHRLRHRDGSYRWILARGALVRDARGQPSRMVGSHLDVSSRHETEQQLRENQLQLEAAERIQRRLLPAAPPILRGFDLAGILEPAAFTAGDDFDFLELKNGKLGIVVSDVSGHGLGPALLMATTHTLMRMLARTGLELSEMVRQANAFLHSETSDARFVSMLLVELDPHARRLRYVNAGHPAGFLLDRHGELRKELPATGPALSIFADTRHEIGACVDVLDGDVLLMMTDGIQEARSPDGTFFGQDRALDVVATHRHEPAAQITGHIYDAVRSHTRQDRLEDDVTVVVLKAESANGPLPRRAPRPGRAHA